MLFSSVQFSRLVMSDPMDYSTPGFPVHHQFPELTQTHVHRVSDAIQRISSSVVPFSSCLQSFPASGFNESVHIRWSKYWNFCLSLSPSNEYSGLMSFRIDWLNLLPVQETLKSLLQHHRSKVINSSALSFLYSPILTSIYDYWKNHSFD